MLILVPAIIFYNIDIDESRDVAFIIFITYGAISPVLILIIIILRYNIINRIIVT